MSDGAVVCPGCASCRCGKREHDAIEIQSLRAQCEELANARAEMESLRDRIEKLAEEWEREAKENESDPDRDESYDYHSTVRGCCLNHADALRTALASEEARRIHGFIAAPACSTCQRPATCLGVYEVATSAPAYACDECCAHGNEDGHCYRLPAPAPSTETEPNLDRTFSEEERES
jgi:hypothetical protein